MNKKITNTQMPHIAIRLGAPPKQTGSNGWIVGSKNRATPHSLPPPHACGFVPDCRSAWTRSQHADKRFVSESENFSFVCHLFCPLAFRFAFSSYCLQSCCVSVRFCCSISFNFLNPVFQFF